MHKQYKEAIRLALKYRADEHQSSGVVLVWAGEVYGWKDALRDPQHERPGALAVDPGGVVWRATGGNYQDGATSWEPIA